MNLHYSIRPITNGFVLTSGVNAANETKREIYFRELDQCVQSVSIEHADVIKTFMRNRIQPIPTYHSINIDITPQGLHCKVIKPSLFPIDDIDFGSPVTITQFAFSEYVIDFRSWLKHGIQDGSIAINEPHSSVHIVEHGVFLEAPFIFIQFLESRGISDSFHRQLAPGFLRLHEGVDAIAVAIGPHQNTSHGSMHGFIISDLFTPDAHQLLPRSQSIFI